jgi:hypothetical protein
MHSQFELNIQKLEICFYEINNFFLDVLGRNGSSHLSAY